MALSWLSSRLAAGLGGPGPDVSVEPWADAVHVFAVNAQVDAHNNYRLQVLEGRGEVVYTIHATHAELLPNGLVSADPVPENLIPGSADECGGLHRTVTLAVGARVMLRRNLDTADKLVNGAMGRVVEFAFQGAGESAAVVGVRVLSDNPEVGRARRELEGMIDHDPVLITRTTSAFSVTSGRMLQRTQFALSLAWGVAVHKTQGITLDRAVLDLGPQLFEAGQAYVALSRVRTREGVALSAFAGKAKVCNIKQEVLRYYQGLEFVPLMCEEMEEEEREHVRERGQGRGRDRWRGQGQGQGQRQEQQQQQQQRGQERSKISINAQQQKRLVTVWHTWRLQHSVQWQHAGHEGAVWLAGVAEAGEGVGVEGRAGSQLRQWCQLLGTPSIAPACHPLSSHRRFHCVCTTPRQASFQQHTAHRLQ